MLYGQTGLLRQKLLEIIGLLGRILLKHTGLLEEIGLPESTSLEPTVA